jgi:hypothetical protein
MKNYVVYGTLPVGVFCTVKAKSKKGAIKIALNNFSPPGLCHQCNGGGSGKEEDGDWGLSDGLSADIDEDSLTADIDTVGEYRWK